MACMKHMSFLLHLLLSLGLNITPFCTSDDHFAYSGFAGSNLLLDGTAMITLDGRLELTNDKASQKGHAFYPTPLHFRKSPNGPVQSFSVTFVFGIISADPDVCTDGMAFFIAPRNNFSETLDSQFLGLLNVHNNGRPTNHIFAVELDTYKNSEFQDIDSNHVGIDINSLSSVHSHTAGFHNDKNGIFENLSLITGDRMQVWVDYDGEATQINVTLAPLKVAKPVRPLISATVNLSTVLTDTAYIGFSAATGPINSRYCVLGWTFCMDGPAPTIDTTKLPKSPLVRLKAQSKVLEIILPIITVAFILAAGTIVIILLRRQVRHAELREDWEVEFGPHRFSYRDLFHATEGFNNKHLLGVGGFGKVYRGVLPTSKLEVAVKKVSHDSKQGMKEFVAEVVSIGRLQHRNLVQLLGYCRRKGELLLVYDYMSNGSLDKYLYCGGDNCILDWAQRFRIIKDVASGLMYLHENWEKVVVHRDIKPSNVLLDSEMNGRLGDFGLARLYDHGVDSQTTHVVGTIGYLAPELTRTDKASPLTDVFAFGAFLLEVTCGQRPINNNARGNLKMLVDWVLEHWCKGSLLETVDKRLQGDYNAIEACIVLKLGLMCSHPFTNARPIMRQIIQYLNGDVPLPELAPTNLSFHMQALMQNEGFDSYIMSFPLSTTCMDMSSSNAG